MKATRFFAFLLVAAMLVTMLPLASFAKSTALKGKTIVAFGDSLTRFGTTTEGGSTTSNSGAYTYPYYLGTSSYLGTPIINAGIGGNTTVHARERFETDVLAHNPNLVLICFGMNDQAKQVTSGEPLIDLNTYRENLTYFAETLKARGCDVVFFTPNPVNTNQGYYTTISYGLNYAGGYLNDFCNAMREVAIDTGCTLVDINYECSFEDLNKFCAPWDGIHHSDYGRRQYANYITKHLEAVYDGTNKAVMTVNCVDENGKTIKSYTLTGATGAHITVATPRILGYSPVEADIKTTFVNGKTYTFNYTFNLNDYIEEAMSVKASEYNEVIIAELRKAVAEAKALMASGDATTDELLLCSSKIEGLLAAKGSGEFVASANKPYTVQGTDHINYKDDGKRLTDGMIGKSGGSNYSGWTSDAEVIVDLGEVTKVNTFRAYMAGAQWGITYPNSLTVSYSTDGNTYTEIGKDTTAELTLNTIEWDNYSMTVKSETPVDARFVKYSVVRNGTFTWLGEVQASLSVGSPVNHGVYVTGFNTRVTAGSCVIFTPDNGEIIGSEANHVWTANVIAEWSDEENAYIVKEIFNGTGIDNTPSITLTEGQIMIAAHDWESGVTDGTEVLGSAENVAKLRSLEVGEAIILDGIDVANKKFDVAPYIGIEKLDVEDDISHGVVENTSPFWVTHFNDMSLEGVGVIATGEKGGAAWWLSVSFKPVAGYDNVYEVVEITDGTASGAGKVLDVPAGGFVWSANYGNNYPALYAQDPVKYAQYADANQYPNYTNNGAQNAIAMAKTWKAGDKFVVDGIDFDKMTIPSSTPGLNWFEAGYACTATINVFNPDAGKECEHNYKSVVTEPTCTDKGYTTYTCEACGDSYVDDETDALGHTEGEWETLEDGSKELHCIVCGELLDSEAAPEYELGDVNADGKINMFDYMKIKSYHFEVIQLTDAEFARADITGDGKVNMFDYMKLKVIVMANN